MVRVGAVASLGDISPRIRIDLLRNLASVWLETSLQEDEEGSFLQEMIHVVMARWLREASAYPEEALAFPEDGAAENGDMHEEAPDLLSIAIHGTVFGRVGTPVETWWKPGSNGLVDYLYNDHRHDIYYKDDHFEWEGGLSDYARTIAAKNLKAWVDTHAVGRRLDAVTHSHGGNVLFRSTNLGASYRKALLLACPSAPNFYWPDFTRIGETISLRVKMDKIILLERAKNKGADLGDFFS